MTKQKIDGRFIVTRTAQDFVNDFVSLEEVDFREMEEKAKGDIAFYEKEMGKQNVRVELFPSEMKTVTSWDL